jgi:hypothetical protein
MKHTYVQFPDTNVHFVQKCRYHADMRFLIHTLAEMNGKFGMFHMYSPLTKTQRIYAKREIKVEIAENGVDFIPLDKTNADYIAENAVDEETIDFRITLQYSYLDEKYNRIPLRGDVYLLRASQRSDILTLCVHHIEGSQHTECSRIADTIIEEIRNRAARIYK